MYIYAAVTLTGPLPMLILRPVIFNTLRQNIPNFEILVVFFSSVNLKIV